MNDTSLLPVPACEEECSPRFQRIDLALGEIAAAERWRGNFLPSDAAAVGDPDFAGDESSSRPEDFLRLWPDDDAHTDRRREAPRWSSLFPAKALQGAVIANGGVLVALALVMVAPNTGSTTGLMASAIVLGLGLMFAAISVAASVNVGGAKLRLARIAAPSWLATISGAVSYGALALAAFPLILIAR